MVDNNVGGFPPYLKPPGQAVFKDSGITKFGEIIQSKTNTPFQGYGLIGVPLSKPSISHSGAAFAPDTMRAILKNMATYAVEEDVDLLNIPLVDFGDVLMHVTNIRESHERIEKMVKFVVQTNPDMIPIILGGDHSISCPAIKGFKGGKCTSVGVIQFDAHHDVRNREDGGPSNGTPFRGLIETGTLGPGELVQIGIRNFSNSRKYTQYALDHGVTVYTMEECRESGGLALVQKAYEMLSQKVDIVYLSVDIDVVDQAFAPGCAAIGPGGMTTNDLFAAVKWLGSQDKTRAIDIVEIDPKQDFRDMTSRVGVFTFLSFLIGKESIKK